MRIFLTGFLMLVCLVSFPGTCMALDWKSFHENAENVSIKEAKENVSRNPDSPDALYVLGLAYLQLHKIDEAQGIFKKIASLDKNIWEARWGQAEVLRQQHRHDESEALLRVIIDEHPEFAPAYMSLAYIKYIQMSFSESAALCAKVINRKRENVDLVSLVRAHGLYAGAKGMLAHYGGPLSKTVNFLAVHKHLDKAKELQPDSVVVYFGFGSYYLLTPSILGQNLGKAHDYLRRAVKRDPGFANPYVRLAQIYRRWGHERKYHQYLDWALKLDPGNELAEDIKSRTCKFICLDDVE